MQLKIPKENAIEILKKRKNEIDGSGFEPTVWQNTTADNLKEIFGGMDFKYSQINQITFDTHWSDFKADVLEKGKVQAKKYLDSYIEQINEFTKIQDNIAEKNESYFEQENKELKSQMMEAISNANFLKDYFRYNWLINPMQVSTTDDTNMNYWQSRNIGPQDIVFVTKPESSSFNNYLSFQNWKISNSLELPVYLIDKGRKQHKIDMLQIQIKSDLEIIYVIREDFYNKMRGVIFVEEDIFL